MNSEPVIIEVPREIWNNIEAAFPWAKGAPDEAVIFLLGVAIGVWKADERAHRLHPEVL